MTAMRLSTRNTRTALAIRPFPESAPIEAPERFIAANRANGPRRIRSHQPWTVSRFESIVLLKISDVSPKKNSRSRVRRMFVVTTAGSMALRSGPWIDDTSAGTARVPAAGGAGVGIRVASRARAGGGAGGRAPPSAAPWDAPAPGPEVAGGAPPADPDGVALGATEGVALGVGVVVGLGVGV